MTILISAFVTIGTSAQEAANDSIKTSTSSEGSNRNMLMNAASASQPRQISLGLPTANWATIYEDGLPVSHYMLQIYPYKSWHSGVSHESAGTMTPQDMVLKYGTISYGVDSKSKLAGDSFEGKVTNTEFTAVNYDVINLDDVSFTVTIGEILTREAII